MNNNFCLGNTSASLAMGVCCPKADVGHVGTSEWRRDQARWNPFFPLQNAMQIILGLQNILLQLRSGRHPNHPCKAPCGLLHASCGIMWRAKVCHVACVLSWHGKVCTIGRATTARIMWNYVDSKGLSCVLSWHGKVCTIGRATTVRKLRKWLSTAQGAGYGNTPANRARQGWQSSVDRNCKCWWFTMGVCVCVKSYSSQYEWDEHPSINPSYFDVNYRATLGFDPTPHWATDETDGCRCLQATDHPKFDRRITSVSFKVWLSTSKLNSGNLVLTIWLFNIAMENPL